MTFGGLKNYHMDKLLFELNYITNILKVDIHTQSLVIGHTPDLVLHSLINKKKSMMLVPLDIIQQELGIFLYIKSTHIKEEAVQCTSSQQPQIGYLVNLHKGSCTCQAYLQESCIPCKYLY